MNLEKPSSEIKTVSKRGISEEEMKKSKEVIEDVEREKEIRERGELQTAAESAEKRAREKYGLLRKEGAKTEKEEKITENKENETDYYFEQGAFFPEEMAAWTRMSEKEIEADMGIKEEILEEQRALQEMQEDIRKQYESKEGERLATEPMMEAERDIEKTAKARKVEKILPILTLKEEVKKTREELAKLEPEYGKYQSLTSKLKHKLFAGKETNEERVQIIKEHSRARQKYEEAQIEHSRVLLDRVKEKASPEHFDRVKKELLFDRFLIKEQERFTRDKEKALPPKEQAREKGLFGKILEGYTKLPKSARWAMSAGLGTGIAFGFGSVACTAILGYAGFRFGRAALGSFSAVGIKGLGDLLEKGWLKSFGKEAREKKIKESLAEQAEKIDDFEQISKLLMSKKEERNEELAKLAKAQRNWRIGKLAAIIGIGGGITLAAGHFDMFGGKAEAAEALERTKALSRGMSEAGPGSKFPPIANEMTAHQTELIQELVKEAQTGELADVPKMQTWEIAGLGGRDSLWKMLAHQMETRYGDDFTALDSAHKTYIIDALKDRVAEHPESFGLTDIDKIAAGQQIEFNSLFEGDAAKEYLINTFNEAGELSKEAADNILKNNEAFKGLVKTHPGEWFTTEKTQQILIGHEGVETATEVKLPEVGGSEFINKAAELEAMDISGEAGMQTTQEAIFETADKITVAQNVLEGQNLSLEAQQILIQDIKAQKEFLGILQKGMDDKFYEETAKVGDLLPEKLIEEAQYDELIGKTFEALSGTEQKQINELFIKNLSGDFSYFRSMPLELRERNISEIGKMIDSLKSGAETTSNILHKTFKLRNLSELKMIQEIWLKFKPGGMAI